VSAPTCCWACGEAFRDDLQEMLARTPAIAYEPDGRYAYTELDRVTIVQVCSTCATAARIAALQPYRRETAS
jgi:hypothetical protein